LKGQLDLLNKEHDRGVQAIKKQLHAVREENARLKRRTNADEYSLPPVRRTTYFADETPSPPDSPVEEKGHATEKLKVQNKMLKKHLTDIRAEMKNSLSPGKALELDTSITALGSGDADNSSSPISSDEIISSNAEMRRRLEHENRLLFKIVDKVKSELMRAGLDTPRSISSSQP
jgi:hypothetical protein